VLNLVLVGFVGGGKTSTANSILGRKEFVVSSTSKVASAQGYRLGIDFNLVDTPGLQTTKDIDLLHQNITKRDGLRICFLVVIKLTRFTDEESFALSEMFRRNSAMLGRTVVVFTSLREIEKKDTITDRAIERYVKRNYTLLSFLKKYGLSYFGIENKYASENEKDKRVKAIIEATKKYAKVLEGGDNGKDQTKTKEHPKYVHRVPKTFKSDDGDDAEKRSENPEDLESHYGLMSIDDHVSRIVQQKLNNILPVLKEEIKQEIGTQLREEIRKEMLPIIREQVKNEILEEYEFTNNSKT
jgi:GTPase SAR1 family protein